MRLPKSLLAAAALMIMTMAASFYVDLRSESMHSRHLAISTGLETIIRLNQELNAMMLVAVLERNTLKSSSYQTVFDQLELSVTAVEKLTGGLDLAEDITALAHERRALRQVELKALELMEADQWSQAHTLLFDEDYILARKIYEINSETAIGALNGQLKTTSATLARIRYASLIVRTIALGLLLWAGLMFSRQLGRQLGEQERLREEIAASNILLEYKVQERTAELEEVNRRLASLSVTDGLTGLANRRHFDEVLQDEWQRALRHGIPLAVAMLDVDEFKAYNDYFGHPAGDQCLRQIAAVLKTCVQRSSDLIARYGGEEFVIVLPGVSEEAAAKLAETIRKTVQAQCLPHTSRSATGVVTVSIGVAARVPSPGDTAIRLTHDADAAMYSAKRQGRNVVVVASPETLQDSVKATLASC